MDRCHDLRPALHKKHLMETKNAQLQQIRENEARREADRELEKMWHHLTIKEMMARVRIYYLFAIFLHYSI
ncbi:hypothetical protein NQ314_012981 [Rhamnusium bicolor]|uniref:Uncharacterized protein n=1 Tax=Rhamnusium bicolor TaxID=1586634 RepID=A0AAV8X977_9CUCU|nr:hypothetical protein NQ314_012981 [Rhamnusium bicolor]